MWKLQEIQFLVFLELCVNVGWHVSLMTTFLVMTKKSGQWPLSATFHSGGTESLWVGLWPTKPKIFIIWLFMEKGYWPLSGSFPDSATQWGRIWITPLVVIKIYRNISAKVCVCTCTYIGVKVWWGTRSGVCVCRCTCTYISVKVGWGTRSSVGVVSSN